MPFRDIAGHRRLLDLLKRSIQRGTLPPSLIFAGPAAHNKRLTAISVAQVLNCASPAGGDACGTCASCTRIARGVHPDMIVVRPGDTGSIKIEQVRDVIDRAAYRPFEGRRRVVIIDHAEALVEAAQNALLKTLEEPQPSSVFILITARPDALLATVRSRCIRLTFAAGATGGPGNDDVDVDAVKVAERVLTYAAANSEPARRIEGAKELLTKTGAGGAGDREQLAAHLRAMASLLRDAELLSARADDSALANADARPVIERLTKVFKGERGVRAFDAIDRALAALDRNAGVKVVADWVVLQL